MTLDPHDIDTTDHEVELSTETNGQLDIFDGDIPDLPGEPDRGPTSGSLPYDWADAPPATADSGNGAEAYPASTDVTPVPARRRRWRRFVGAVAALVLISGGAAAWSLWPDTDAEYTKALKSAALLGDYPSTPAAIAHAHAFCQQLANGHDARGYASESVAVHYYCKSYEPGFVVIPTPAEQQKSYLQALRAGSLGGTFSSDAAAVAHAQSTCSALTNGGKQQGLLIDLVGVNTYCAQFSTGFHVLAVVEVTGSLTLYNISAYSSNGTYDDGSCYGRGGYSDITSGAAVTVKNSSGEQLASTTLGAGVGTSMICTFPFSVRLTEGEDDYVTTVSHRGGVHYTFAAARTSGMRISLGL